MLNDVSLGTDETLGAFGLQQVAWREIEDTPEAADVMSAFDREPPKGQVGEVGIEGSLWMAGEKSPFHPLFRILLSATPNRDPRALQRSARAPVSSSMIEARGSSARFAV